MEKKYYIIGSGGLAKEVHFLADQVLGELFNFKGFIDYNPQISKIKIRGKEENVLDEIYFLENILPNEDIYLYLGVGDPQLLNKLSKRFKGYNFPNLIHDNFVGDENSIQFGSGNIVTAGCTFTVDIKIGSFNIFNLNTTVGHDTVVGNCNVFHPASNISGDVKIGSRNLFGTDSTVLQQLEIKNDNVIGGSTLINKPVDNGGIIVGVPGKNLKK